VNSEEVAANDREVSNAGIRGLLEASPDAMVGSDDNGRIVLVNFQAEELFGYARQDLIGQPVDLLVPELLRPAVTPEQAASGCLESELRPMGPGLELVGHRKDGHQFPAEISLSAIDTEQDDFIVAAIRDGTDRRQAAIVSSSNDAMISKSLDGTITSWNPGAARLFGYGASEVLGRSIEILIPREHRDAERTALARAASGERIVERETVRLRADGTLIDVASTVAPIVDSSGRVMGISSIARDITDRKRAREVRAELGVRLIQSQRLESLGQLAGGIAHDFNNLLAVILNYASFVAEAISDNETARADVERIRIAAERAADLTRQLLIFSRGEEVQPAFIDVTAVVGEVETLLSRTLGEQVDLVVRAAPELPTVRADRGQLEQVLVNLAVNARDAMPDGGVLTIETDTVLIGTDNDRLSTDLSPGLYVTMTVSDTGIGMSAEVLAHVFEPFFTTKPRGEGSGLGLATVYGIVSEAGGAVTFHSEGGLGTTVRVYLPAADEPATFMPPAGVLVGGAGETVLVVEDAQAMREVTSRILRRNGYEALEAASGEEAISILETRSCDLLLTDVIMPRMSGRDLVERVHVLRPDLPVLYMSGYSQGVLGPARELDRAVALIQKPFDETSLVQKVRAALDGDARSP
jgi:hypothetical protein